MAEARCAQRAIDACVAFVVERLNGEDGLGAIYPAMANSVMMFDCLGYHRASAHIARAAVEKLVVRREDGEVYCQPCVSPVWDTALAAHAMLEVRGADAEARGRRAALDWLMPLQVLDVKGDWADNAPDVRPGGWAFQYHNAHYPDLDDTAVVVMAMDRARGRAGGAYDEAIARGANGPSGCSRRTAAGARSTPTTAITTSTTSPSPTTARCSIRRPPTSPRAACRCWRSSASRPDGADARRRSPIC